MSKEIKSDTTAEAKTPSTVKTLQSIVDIETAQGFRGTEVDQTPNENYTVAGVTSGKPTPENAENKEKGVK